jgi:DNA-binding response OmpR family regulator
VIRQLRALDVAAPVQVFTGIKSGHFETASLDAGADDFIPQTTSIRSVDSRIRAQICRGELAICSKISL